MTTCTRNMHGVLYLGQLDPGPRCQDCGRSRCKAKGPDQEQCRRFPSNDTAVCHAHGGGTSASRGVKLINDIRKKAMFWNPDRPQITDIGEAIIDLASNLQHTYDSLSGQLDEALSSYKDEMRAYRLNAADGACMCCGARPEKPEHPLKSAEAHTWQFVVRELSTLLQNIQKLGILERAVALEEAKVSLVVAAIERASLSLGLEEAQLRTFRDTFVTELRAIETRRAVPEEVEA